MGKAASLFAAATVIAVSFLMVGQQRTTVETDKRQGEYQEEVLARQAAEDGLQIAVSNVRRNFDTWRSGYSQVGYDGGSFDVNLQGSAAGPVTVTAEGHYGGAVHQAQATVARLAPAPAAVIIDADTMVTAFAGSNVVISGQDTRPLSAVGSKREGSGHGTFANGVWTRTSQVRNAFSSALAGLGVSKIRGVNAVSDIVLGSNDDMMEFPVDLGQMLAEAEDRADQRHTPGMFADETFGAADAPEIVVISGDASFSGNTHGYGMLIVKGNLSMSGNFQWEGIVVAKSYLEEMNVSAMGNATIYGMLFIQHAFLGSDGGGGEEEEEDCPIDWEIDDNEVVAQQDFRVEISVLGAAMESGGYNSFDMPITAQIVIGGEVHEPWGDWDYPVSSNLNTGSTFSFSPEDVFTAGTPIRINARAWTKRSTSYSGSSNNHWQVFSEKDSRTVDNRLRVLRDGDSVPNVGGYGGQASVQDFVSGYIDGGSGEVTLEDDQAINLFELGTSSTSSAYYDLQDLVVVVRLVREQPEEEGCPGEDEGGIVENIVNGLTHPSGPVTGSVVAGSSFPASWQRILCDVNPSDPASYQTRTVWSWQISNYGAEDYDGECAPIEVELPDERLVLPGIVNFTMNGNAAVHYSTEALGKLAARLPSVREASWTVKFDQVVQADDVVSVSNATVSLCHTESGAATTISVAESALAKHLSHGDYKGACQDDDDDDDDD